MPTLSNITVEPAQASLWLPAVKRSPALKPSTGTVHTYTADQRVLTGEAEWVHLEVVTYAEQYHPATIEYLDGLGPIEGRDMARWTVEGPMLLFPGEDENCSMRVEVSHSESGTAGTDWRLYEPGPYKLRAFNVRLVIERPSTSHDFRVYRLATRATRLAPQARDYLGSLVFG